MEEKKAARKRVFEKVMEIIFLLCACMSILAVALICFFLFTRGIPGMAKIGIFKFLGGQVWKPGNDIYGILPMILGSVYVTGLALVIGVPIGLLTAIFLARFCPKKLYKVVKPAVDLLAGIPSVVYGFFGMVVIVPVIRALTDALGARGNGVSLLTASILLGIMILPTIISVSEASIRAVPESYYEGSLGLGADPVRSGRAIGETMAVIMVAGNNPAMPKGLLQGVRTLTANIVIEMGYAQDLHREALIATGVVLFVFILIINLCFSIVKRRDK